MENDKLFKHPTFPMGSGYLPFSSGSTLKSSKPPLADTVLLG
jgi:hypothetical protein